MLMCGICKKQEEALRNFDDFVGDPPILLSKLLVKCTRGTKCKFIVQGICNGCVDELLCYYECIMTAKRIRRKLIELLENTEIYAQHENDWQDVEKLIEVVTDATVEERESQIEDVIEQEELDDMDDDKSQEFTEYNEEELSQEFVTDSESIAEPDTKMHESDTEDEGDDIDKGCAKCGERFKDAVSWKIHKRDKHRQGFVCEQCGKHLRTRDGLAMHLKTHDPDKPLACKICGKRYHFEIHLKNHMAWHTGEKPYECKICQKRFVNYGLLANHKIIHKELPEGIECHICGKRFRQPCRLNQHMTTHSKEKPFSCNYCDYRFSSKYLLKSHLKSNKKCSRHYKSERQLAEELKEFVVQEEFMVQN